MKTHWGPVDLAHVQPLEHRLTELGVCPTSQELVQLDQQSVVRVLGLDDLHGALVPHTASTSFQINTHVYSVIKLERKGQVRIAIFAMSSGIFEGQSTTTTVAKVDCSTLLLQPVFLFTFHVDNCIQHFRKIQQAGDGLPRQRDKVVAQWLSRWVASKR